MLMCAEELDKILIGAPLRWPLKEEHEKRIETLKRKCNNAKKVDAIRPTFSLYNHIVKVKLHSIYF